MVRATNKDLKRKNIISLRNINYNLSDNDGNNIKILANINLDLFAGEFVAITGPSGSGKTSLIMIMSGIERPSSGTIIFDNSKLDYCDENILTDYRKNNIGIVFQNFHLINNMTALENVATALEISNIDSPFEKAAEALESVGLSNRLKHYPSQLSGGEQQRVAIARSYATKPRILFADEPTGSLDHGNGIHILKLLMDLSKKQKSALVIVTHDEEIAARADRRIRISDGRLEN